MSAWRKKAADCARRHFTMPWHDDGSGSVGVSSRKLDIPCWRTSRKPMISSLRRISRYGRGPGGTDVDFYRPDFGQYRWNRRQEVQGECFGQVRERFI
jgi:hypothetical protein